MKKSTLIVVCCLMQLTAFSITLSDMKCENLVRPNAIDSNIPHFSWKKGDRSAQQQYCELQVATDSLQLTNGKADLWDSGRMQTSASVMVAYNGKELTSRMLCYWRVRVTDTNGETSAWSPIQRFGVGILDGDRLRGDYIGLSVGNGDVRSPLLRKTFIVKQQGTAFLHVNSLGYHEVYINGVKADRRVLAPATSQLNKRSLIVTYDITAHLRRGENELVLWLGQGWYKKTTYGAEYDGPLVKAEMNMMQKGKWKSILVTDATWTGRESGYSDTGTWQANRFGGERIDGRILPGSLATDELNRLQWFPVTIVAVAPHRASPQMCEPNGIHESLTPQSIRAVGENTWLVDIGKVLTGWFELRLPQLPAGHEVTATYSDDLRLDPEFKDQRESDVYIASGKPTDVFCNKFNHHAFRYVKITNLPQQPSVEQIKAHFVHGDYTPAATFECSDADLNAIHNLVQHTVKCLTFSGYMVDCPHIERAGYGGDGNSSTLTLQTMFDASPFFYNWLQSWRDAMREDGGLPHIAPNPGADGGGPYWCGFVVQAPWRTFVNYGDRRPMEHYYDAMKQWLGYVDKYSVHGLLKRWPDTSYRNWYLGDWLAPRGVDAGSQHSIDLVNNCFISDCLSVLQKIAVVLGRTDDAAVFADRKKTLNHLIHQTFYNPEEGIYSTGSQLDLCYPMLTGVVPDSLYQSVKEQMIRRSMQQYGGHIAVGLVGVPILTEWTIRNSEVDFMYRMLKQPDYPGYLYMINNRATTTWEYWSGERSRVHNCYNGIGTWFYQAIGGIRPDEDQPGYRHVYINPQIPQGVSWAKTTKETPYGTIIVNWELMAANKLRIHVDLPAGVEATLTVPEKAIDMRSQQGEMQITDSIRGKATIDLKQGVFDADFTMGEQ